MTDTASSASSPSPLLRRRLLGATAAAVLGVPQFLRQALAQARLQPTPAQTEGPFYPEDFSGDSDFDLLTQPGRRYTAGQAAWVTGSVLDTSGRPLAGAQVEIWQCDQQGRYRHSRDGGRADPDFQGHGRLTLGRDGSYRFRSIRPVAYVGRTPHIHVKVRLGQRELLTTQLYVEGDPGNARDGIWRRLSEQERAAVTRPFVSGPDGLVVQFPLVVEA